jgi:hypothetical protein
MLRPYGRAALAAGLLMLMSRLAIAAMHATPEFESGATRPHSIVFLPPHASVIKKKVIHAEEQLDEEADLSGYLAANVLTAFQTQGYDVKVLTPEQVNAEPELQALVLDADRRYAEVLGQIRMKLPRQIAKHRYAAGDEMRLLAAKLGVDAIGFADMHIVAATGGSAAVGILFGFGMVGTATNLSVSVIDGSSAQIEAYFAPGAHGYSLAGYEAIMADPAGKIREIAQFTLSDLPTAAAASSVPGESDADVVKDVESLLKK